MADKVVLAEDSYLAGCAYFHTAYHRRGYRHMEVFSAVCYQECHWACCKDYHPECHWACCKDYRPECMGAYRQACRMERRKVYMEAYRVSAGDMDWN